MQGGEIDDERDGSSAPAMDGSTALRRDRIVTRGAAAALMLLGAGWLWVIGTARKKPAMAAEPTATARLSTSLTSVDAPTTAYLTDASLRALSGELRGTSGKLRAQIRPAGAAIGAASSGGTMVAISESLKSGSEAAPSAGIWKLAVAVGSVIQPIADFNLISTRASSEKRNGRLGLYFIGNWPGEGGTVSAPSKAPADRYRPPSGFIEVTQENADTHVSEHFKLRDFLTHDQPNVWPKYLVLEMRTVH